MSNRDLILNKIRETRKTHPIKEHPGAGIKPYVARPLLEHFKEKVLKSAATYTEVSNLEEIKSACLSFIREHQLHGAIFLSDTEILNAISWGDYKTVKGTCTAEVELAIMEANTGIAETGSLVMFSGQERPIASNFLPEYVIYIIEASQIVLHMEDIWTEALVGHMPRSVNVITGPSRTADVEQTIQMGAHGPRHMHVIVVSIDGN